MRHWFHMARGRGRRLAAYAAGELPQAERARVEIDLRSCPACRREVEAYRRVSGTLRTQPLARLTPEQSAMFWAGVERRIRTDTTAAARPARPALRELFWDHPRLSVASAVAAVILVLGVTLGQMEVWSPWAPTVPNGVEVISIEAGEDAPVMVFQAPGSSLKVIWVFEKPTS
jgi:anti-sigma factor RsiW